MKLIFITKNGVALSSWHSDTVHGVSKRNYISIIKTGSDFSPHIFQFLAFALGVQTGRN